MHQFGFSNCVAPLGTSINHERIIDLTKKGYEIIVCLDGDLAGRNASLRLMNNLLSSKDFELGVKFVLLPKNYDPDLMLESQMKDQLIKLINQPLNIEQFIDKYLDKYFSSNDIDEQFKGSKALKGILSSIENLDLKKILKSHFNKNYKGDIAICYEIINLRSKKTNFNIEFDKMWIHGYLHLIGYDHKKLNDYRTMLKREKIILKYFHKAN